jgi:hypothetical protein
MGQRPAIWHVQDPQRRPLPRTDLAGMCLSEPPQAKAPGHGRLGDQHGSLEHRPAELARSATGVPRRPMPDAVRIRRPAPPWRDQHGRAARSGGDERAGLAWGLLTAGMWSWQADAGGLLSVG